MSKEAIVFIVDGNLTMNKTYPPVNERLRNDDDPTRLSQAKDAVLTSIIDLMWRSKTHETGVVVLKSGITHHHLSEIERITDDHDVGKFFRRCQGGYKLQRYENPDDDDEEESDVFPNLVEFDLNRPSPHTLRALKFISCTINDQIAESIQGDLCDGLILAADALHRRTNNKKYKRKIVMITDAEHEVEVNGEQLQCVLDGLKKMEVELVVVGIGFQDNVIASSAVKTEDNNNNNDNNDVDSDHENNGGKKPEAVGSMNGCDEDDNNDLDKKPEAVVSMEEDNDTGDVEEMMVKEEGNPDEMMLDEDWRQPDAIFPGSNGEDVTAFLHGNEESKTFTHFNDISHASNFANKYFGGSNGCGKGDGSGYNATAKAGVNEESGGAFVTITKVSDAKKEATSIIDQQLIKRENEKLIASIARETGGCVLAANGVNLSDLLQTKFPLLAGSKKSAPRKLEFKIAPGLTLEVKNGKLTDKLNLPTTIKEAYQINPETGEKLRDGNGDLMTLPTRTDTRHYEEDGNEVPFDKRTDSFRYGADLLPVGPMDMLGIKAAFADPGSIEMIGYLDKKDVETSHLLMGPAYAFTGGDSKKARTAIAALSQALEETNKVGYCRIVRTKDADPKIGVLLPKLEGRDDGNLGTGTAFTEGKGGRYLAFLEMPFADDIQHHRPRPVPLEHFGDNNDATVCDDLVESMMLPDDQFQSEDVSFPALKAHQRMVAFYAINPLSPEEEMQQEGLAEDRIAEASQAKPLSELDVVKAVSKKASKPIDTFVKTFPLVHHKKEDEKKRKYWGDASQ